MISIIKIKIDKQTRLDVCKTLRSGMIAQGKMVKEFENKFSEYMGTEHGIATSSGTTALHTALLSLGIGEGDEVIIPSFTFVATANVIKMCGATPVFCDIGSATYNMNPHMIEDLITDKTKVIMPVHLYGNPCDMEAIMEIADKHKLMVIEDCCQAHGAKINNRYVGTFGDCGVFSFYPTKNMTCGEGGIIITDDKEIDISSRIIREHGTISGHYNYFTLGFNYRMSDINATIGLAQLKKLTFYNTVRRATAKTYDVMINNELVETPFHYDCAEPSWNLYTVRLESKNQNLFIKYLADNGIQTETYYRKPLHKQPYFSDIECSCPMSELMSNELVSIPIRPNLEMSEIKHIIKTINNFEGK